MLFFKGKEKKERTSNLSGIRNLFSSAAPPTQSHAEEAKNHRQVALKNCKSLPQVTCWWWLMQNEADV